MVSQNIKGSIDKLLGFPLERFNWKFLRNFLFVICLVSFWGYRIIAGYIESTEDQQHASFTIKIVDEKGQATVLYQNKNIEAANGLIYVCPLATLNCAKDKQAIILSGNFIIERQN